MQIKGVALLRSCLLSNKKMFFLASPESSIENCKPVKAKKRVDMKIRQALKFELYIEEFIWCAMK